MPHIDQIAEYVLRAEGCLGNNLDQEIVDRFGAVNIADFIDTNQETVTTLSGIVTDQAGLVGLIRHLHSLGIVLLSVERKALDR